MMRCKVFLTYKRKRQSLVSEPKETRIHNSNSYNGLIDKSPSEDDTLNSLHLSRGSPDSPSTQKSSHFETEKNTDECSEGSSKRNIVLNNSHYLQMGSSSSVNADILGDTFRNEGTATAMSADYVELKPSFERKNSFETCDTPSMSKTSKDYLTVLGTDSAEATRFRAPLITFIRRCKRKRDVEGDDQILIKRSNTSLCEVASENGCDATDSKPLEEAHYTSDMVCRVENKILGVDSAAANATPVHNADTLTLERVEPLDEPNVSKKDVHEDRIASDVQELSEISLNNTMRDTSFNKREESRAIFNDDVKATTEGPSPVLDLSVTPIDSSGTLERNVYLDSNSQKRSVHAVTETVLGSMDSTSRSHAAASHQTFPIETSNLRSVFVEEPSPNCKDSNKASPIPQDFMSKTKCLQLFAEERAEDSFQSCMVSEERKIFRCEIENNPPRRKSPPILGLSLPTKPKTSRYTSKMCFPTFPFLSSIGETSQPFDDTPPQSSSSRFSLFLRHNSMLDGIVSRARTLGERETYFQGQLRPYASAWTEEELDSLWIGVRRYGRDSWHTMIRDPRLRFSSWRVATDLAEQWEEEQCKLFQYHHSKPQGVVSSGIDETRLSLGDVYNNDARRGRNVSRRARFKSAKNGPANSAAIRGSYVDYQGVRFEDDGFNNCCPTKGNLPHWLREAVFSPPSSQRGPMPLAPAVATVARPRFDHYESQRVGPRSETRSVFGGLRGKDLQTPGDVIVIESDASSEETISDHR